MVFRGIPRPMAGVIQLSGTDPSSLYDPLASKLARTRAMSLRMAQPTYRVSPSPVLPLRQRLNPRDLLSPVHPAQCGAGNRSNVPTLPPAC
jgi:hypothetical protein